MDKEVLLRDVQVLRIDAVFGTIHDTVTDGCFLRGFTFILDNEEHGCVFWDISLLDDLSDESNRGGISGIWVDADEGISDKEEERSFVTIFDSGIELARES